MTVEQGFRRWWRLFVAADYYLAALLLLVAGCLKLRQPEVSELLQTLLEQELFPLSLILFAARWQAWFEIALALVVLSGWQSRWCARGLALLYLFFAMLIAVAADGYWLAPIDCGCFGSGGTTPAYLLLLRNIFLALPLFFVKPAWVGNIFSAWRNSGTSLR